jgi:hypothetical protein
MSEVPRDAVALQAGDVVFVVPRSMFRGDVEGVVHVGEHQVPAKVIYAAWALGTDQGMKVGLATGGALTLLLVLAVRGAATLWRRYTLWRRA